MNMMQNLLTVPARSARDIFSGAQYCHGEIFRQRFPARTFFTIKQTGVGNMSVLTHFPHQMQIIIIAVNSEFTHIFSNLSTSVTNTVAPPTSTSTGSSIPEFMGVLFGTVFLRL